MKANFFTESILYFLARGVSRLAQKLPPAASVLLGAWGGSVLYHFAGKRRAVAMGNLRSAFGDGYSPHQYEKILRAIYRNMGRMLMEIAAIPRIDRAYVDRCVQIAPGSRERLDQALAQGKGVLFVTGHFGNWELISLTGALHGYPTLVLAREQGWPKLNRMLTEYRESKGCKVVNKGFPIRELIRGLKEGRIVGILADQDGGRNGVLAPLFDRLASTAPGIIEMGIKTGAPILPVFMVRLQGPQHSLTVEDPLEIPEEGAMEERVKAGVAAYMAVMERYIRRYPDHWLWLHRRWKTCPERHLVVLSDGKAGHLSQSRGLVERIKLAWLARAASDPRLAGNAKPLVWMRMVQVEFRHPALRPLLAAAASLLPARCPRAEWLLRLALRPETYRALAACSADITISCGSSAAAVNLIWSWAVRAKTAHITRSAFPSWRRFDLAVIPRHDLRRPSKARNVLEIDGALVPLRRQEQRGKEWRDRLKLTKERRIGVLLGGSARNVELTLENVQQVMKSLLAAAEELDAELLVTSSRRTPLAIETWLAQEVGSHPRCRLLALVNRRDPGRLNGTEEAVPCIFDLAHAIVVSGDSISMISEALATAKPVISFAPEPVRRHRGEPDTKHHRFLRRMAGQGSLQVAEPARMRETLAAAFQDGADPARRGKPPAPQTDPVVEFLKKWL